MSDRIAIFGQGRIEQLGSGEDLYERPARRSWPTSSVNSNILRGRYETDGVDGGWMTRGAAHWRVGPAAAAQASLQAGAAAAIVIRPERTRIVDPDGGRVAWGERRRRDGRGGAQPRAGHKYELTLESGERVAVREPRERRRPRAQARRSRPAVVGRSTTGCSSPIRAARTPSTRHPDRVTMRGVRRRGVASDMRRSTSLDSERALTVGAPRGRVPPLVRRHLPRRARRQEPAHGDGLRDPVPGVDGAGRRSRSRRCSSTPARCSSGPCSALALPHDADRVVAGVAFLVFAAWTIRGDELGEDDEAARRRAAAAGRC